MLEEYAVDPDSINNFADFRYVVDSCGIDHGRLIAEYPKDWARRVYKAAKEAYKGRESGKKNPVQNLKSFEDRLARLKRSMTNRESYYDETREWLLNAEKEHSTSPFKAILSFHNPRLSDDVLIVKDLKPETDKWKVETQKNVERKAEPLASALDPIFRFGSEFIFVDPHFSPYASGGEPFRFRDPLISFINHIKSNCASPGRIEYHLLADADRAAFEGNLKYYLIPQLPSGVLIKFVRWKDLPYSDTASGGRRLHPRFVLTERTGVFVDPGLDEGNDGDAADLILLSSSLHRTHWNNYQRATTRFDFVDEIEVIGAGT